jgi:hypothetical protein
LRPQRACRLQRALDQPRSDAALAKLWRHLCVGEGHHAVGEAVIGQRRHTFGGEFERDRVGLSRTEDMPDI